MVNHVRTALLNMAPALAAGPGEEYVSSDYKPVNLPQNIKEARSALFGQNADRTAVNLTLARILTFLHSSRFANDVLVDDTRITYLKHKPVDVFSILGPSFITRAGPDPVGWFGSSTFTSTTRTYNQWLVSTDGAGNYTVISAEQTSTGSVIPITLGDSIPLSSSRLSLVIPTSAVGLWLVALLVPPNHNWTNAITAAAEGIFNPQASTAENNWFSVWSDPYESAPLRAGALALALAKRIHEISNA